MLWNKIRGFFPKTFFWRLTLLNITITALFIVVSSWAIYSTACFLVEGMGGSGRADAFRARLRTDLWVFSIAAISVGGFFHIRMNRTLVRPLQLLIGSIKELKAGGAPGPVQARTDGEMEELIRHFNELSGQLQHNRRQQKKLVSDLSHEIRTPVTNLNGYLNALKTGMVEGSPELYEALHQETRRLIDLLEQFDQLKEWENSSHEHFLDKKPAAVREVTAQAAGMFSWQLEDRGIPFEMNVEPAVFPMDRHAIAQVLANLLDNAIRYYDGPGPVRLTGQSGDGRYELAVEGPGLPIPTDSQEIIFERFARMEPSRHRSLGGAGLGLAISKEIVERHGGEIGVDTDGHVHRFWFWIGAA
ncbi:sensor histidine kinase [Bhargavaea cecembensis]|uniref:sensor histidine kinase n=1 Tax=Bhargavaea cecembensis TaxID=394098 RepID=UPI00058CAEA5|nr:HAMP domain-containing sensor histidine kinase [Bhargavaea cecembensis]